VTFDQLIDWAACEILKGLIAGEFRSTVYEVLETARRWTPPETTTTKGKGKHVD
jgi:hypothetical protein